MVHKIIIATTSRATSTVAIFLTTTMYLVHTASKRAPKILGTVVAATSEAALLARRSESRASLLFARGRYLQISLVYSLITPNVKERGIHINTEILSQRG